MLCDVMEIFKKRLRECASRERRHRNDVTFQKRKHFLS